MNLSGFSTLYSNFYFLRGGGDMKEKRPEERERRKIDGENAGRENQKNRWGVGKFEIRDCICNWNLILRSVRAETLPPPSPLFTGFSTPENIN